MTSKPRFENGLNKPVNDLPEASYYKQGVDGMVVYSWSDGSISIGENTKLMYQDISHLRATILNFGQHMKKGWSGAWLITVSQSLILNMDYLKKVCPTIIFLGIFDENNVFVEAHDVAELHQHLTFTENRKVALSCPDPSVIHVFPKISRSEAVELFDKHQDIICHNPGKHPQRWFDENHFNAREAVSGLPTPYQIFVRCLAAMIGSIDKYDSELVDVCKQKVPFAVYELDSIQCQTSWLTCGNKFLEDLDKLMAFKKSYYEKRRILGKDPKCIKKGYNGNSEEFPPKFLETFRLRIPNRGFLGKVFFKPANASRMLNKIGQYTISN